MIVVGLPIEIAKFCKTGSELKPERNNIMANQEHLDMLKAGVASWNNWKLNNSTVRIDLSGANLHHAELSGADLSGVNLGGANLSDANLQGANLSKAVLGWSSVRLGKANLSRANLHKAD